MACYLYNGVKYTEGDLVKLLQSQQPKTRRILELQSDLFQKGRDKKDLITPEGRGQLPIKQLEELNNGTLPKFLSEYTDFNGLLSEKIQVFPHNNKLSFWQNKEYDDKIGSIVSGESQNQYGVKFWTLKDEIAQPLINKYKKSLEDEIEKNRPKPTKENDFLQLLNKDNNWVTFFIKSIIQDSSKKGYEKVLFPTGNTASKVEGHSTLEEFKKEKEDRINAISNIEVVENEVYKKAGEEAYSLKLNNGQLEGVFNTKEDANKHIEGYNNEITQLKQELERVETEGFGALKPIYNFYENTVTNILNKTYGKDNVKTITDEYGNHWREISINQSRDLDNILLQKNEANRIIGQANIKAMTILVDAVNKKADTIPHEYAHHYIAWFRGTPIVQEGIKRFGSEEALVQAIGEQVVKQKGEAYNWWKKFTNWILNLLSDKQLLQILTDSFLNRQDLNDFTYNQNTKNQYGLYKTNTVKEAVEEFISWMIGEKHTDKLQNYRQAIINKIPELKGKPILYYKDLGRPSHATALDYLINKYDWNNVATNFEEFKKNLPKKDCN